jgi:hypothetical protein
MLMLWGLSSILSPLDRAKRSRSGALILWVLPTQSVMFLYLLVLWIAFQHIVEMCVKLRFRRRVTRWINTYDHRSVRTGHPVRNHEVSIVFIVPGTKML